VPRLNEIVATGTYFSDTLAPDDGIGGHGGATLVQDYCGRTIQITDAYPMHSETEMPGTLEDFIRRHGAPKMLYSDNAKVQVSKAVQDILCLYCIDDFQSEPHHQQQNYAERRIQELKKYTNGIMGCTGTPPSLLLLCLIYIIYLLNHLAVRLLNWRTPIGVATGQVRDISSLLQYRWLEPVYYAVHSMTNSYPSCTQENTGHWVVVATQGDALTFLI